MLSTPLASRPQPLGLRRSFGFGDRLGLATPGHALAARRFEVAPVFAQISIRDRERLRRSGPEMVGHARSALAASGFRGAWGADLEGIKTEGDVDRGLADGFSWFSIDPSAFFEPRADQLEGTALAKALSEVSSEGALPVDWERPFATGTITLGNERALRFTPEDVKRAAVKFARAIHHVQRLARRLAQRAHADDWEIEIALTGATTPTTPLEHLFVGIEAQRRGIVPVAIAPRLATSLEPGIDAPGLASAFTEDLEWHAAIARHCGPYKVSVHAMADKFSLLPLVGRVCGDFCHVKTAGLSFIEALRVVCRSSPELFREIARQARARFAEDRHLSGVSTTPEEVALLSEAAGQISLENAFLGTPSGRQLMLATSMSILTGDSSFQGRTLRECIARLVAGELPLYRRLVDEVHTRHLEAFTHA